MKKIKKKDSTNKSAKKKPISRKYEKRSFAEKELMAELSAERSARRFLNNC